jgi:hypothetical protein
VPGAVAPCFKVPGAVAPCVKVPEAVAPCFKVPETFAPCFSVPGAVQMFSGELSQDFRDLLATRGLTLLLT